MAPNFAKLPELLRAVGCFRRVISQMNMRDEWLRRRPAGHRFFGRDMSTP